MFPMLFHSLYIKKIIFSSFFIPLSTLALACSSSKVENESTDANVETNVVEDSQNSNDAARNCTFDHLCLQPSVQSHDLRKIWGSSANDIWIVGETGTVLHWNESQWKIEPQFTKNHLYAVTGTTSGSSVWVAGEEGFIRYWNSNTWAEETNTDTSKSSIFDMQCCVGNMVWAVGDQGTMLTRSVAEQWTKKTSTLSNHLHGVWFAANGLIWVVGSNGGIGYWDSDKFSTLMASGDFQAIWGTQGKEPDIWVVGTDGAAYRCNKNLCLLTATSTTETLHRIWGSGPDRIWAVGNKGVILRWNGERWFTLDSGTKENLYGVWGSGLNDVWFVGAKGTIIKYQLK